MEKALVLLIAHKILSYMYVGTTNNVLTGGIVDASSLNNLTINCTFLSGFTGSAQCTVQYGTDPTFMNLPYSAESTETGTAGDSVSVILRERLNSSTLYYYTVSAVSGDVTVTVQGSFTTPQYSKYIRNNLILGFHTVSLPMNLFARFRKISHSLNFFSLCDGENFNQDIGLAVSSISPFINHMFRFLIVHVPSFATIVY